MRRLGLRERLLLFYALMALLPVMLSGGLLYHYIERQTSWSARQFQQGLQQELRHYRTRLEQGVEQVLADSQRQMSQHVATQVEAQQAQLQRQQVTLVRRTMQALQTTTREALRTSERHTARHLDQTLRQVATQVHQAQTDSLRTLEQQTAATTREALQAIITQHLTQLSAQISLQIESLLRNYSAQLTLIAQQPAIQTGEAQQSRWILQALQDREPAYVYLCLVDAHGAPHLELGDSIDDRMLVALERGQLWARLQETQETVWGQARLHRVDGRQRPLIPMIVPIRRMGQETVGAVFALVNPESAHRLVQGARMGERGVAILVQEDGLILAHSDVQRVGERETRFQPLLRDLTQPKSQLYHGAEGEWLAAVAPVRRLHAALVVAQPAEEAFHLVSELQTSLKQQFQSQQAAIDYALTQASQNARHQFRLQTQAQQAQVRQSLRQAEQKSLEQSAATLDALSQSQQHAILQLINSSFEHTQEELRQGLAARLHEASQRTLNQIDAIAATMRFRINEQLRASFMAALSCVLVFLLVGGWFLHRNLVRPLRALVAATHDIAAGNLNRRVVLPVRGYPDLDDLADSFNHMVDAVQKAEAQLIQSSKLASLGTLASGVAHELNQPLAIIRAIAQQNLETLDNSPTPLFIQQLREDLQIIHRQTVRMSQIIQHLRAFSRKPREEFEPVNLNEVAQNALILLREQLRQRGIELVEAYEPALPPVLGEANSLEQIAINLLTNARDALEERDGGRITIATGLYDDGKRLYAELRVRDNGPGVPPDIRPQIFDPFFTTKDPNKGTGLGLAISQEIAQKHGGVLLLGDVEQGAEFILRVPVAEVQHAAA
ncbi:MAG: hypothetical protein CFK48_10605 [Armatimonadetes bacterium CP1_7O]|nr:MAG: hypothetical protein CFK48_10605 [Armatimonadetes bacterium CP1_7O]